LMRISQAQALCTSTFWQTPFAEHVRSLRNSVPAILNANPPSSNPTAKRPRMRLNSRNHFEYMAANQ
jgi:hypothetical protein